MGNIWLLLLSLSVNSRHLYLFVEYVWILYMYGCSTVCMRMRNGTELFTAYTADQELMLRQQFVLSNTRSFFGCDVQSMWVYEMSQNVLCILYCLLILGSVRGARPCIKCNCRKKCTYIFAHILYTAYKERLLFCIRNISGNFCSQRKYKHERYCVMSMLQNRRINTIF
jgi:hypothetical protein